LHVDFNPAAVFKMVATMCESGNSTIANVLEMEFEVEQGHEDTVEGLLSGFSSYTCQDHAHETHN
jgi:hypothetical protein